MDQSKPTESKPKARIHLGPMDPSVEIPTFITVETCGALQQLGSSQEADDDDGCRPE